MKIVPGIALLGVLTAGFISCKGKSDTKGDKNAGALSPAITRMMQQVKEHPDSTGLRLQLAGILDSATLYKEALAQMDSLISKDSLNYGLWYYKSQVWEHAGDTASAIAGYEQAIRIYPAPEALLSLASLFAEKKDKRALVVCNNVAQMRLGREYDAHCGFIAGVYFARTGDSTRAVQQFNNCIAANYTYMEAYIEKGLVYFDHKNYPQALEVFRFASGINNLYPDAYYYQARAFEMMGQKDSAILRFKQSLSLDKNLKEARAGLQRLEK